MAYLPVSLLLAALLSSMRSSVTASEECFPIYDITGPGRVKRRFVVVEATRKGEIKDMVWRTAEDKQTGEIKELSFFFGMWRIQRGDNEYPLAVSETSDLDDPDCPHIVQWKEITLIPKKVDPPEFTDGMEKKLPIEVDPPEFTGVMEKKLPGLIKPIMVLSACGAVMLSISIGCICWRRRVQARSAEAKRLQSIADDINLEDFSLHGEDYVFGAAAGLDRVQARSAEAKRLESIADDVGIDLEDFSLHGEDYVFGAAAGLEDLQSIADEINLEDFLLHGEDYVFGAAAGLEDLIDC